MKALIKVEIRTIGDRPIQSVSARELHAFLESSTRFNDGIARRIAEYRVEEGKDFYSFLSKTSQDEAQGGCSLKWAEDVLVLMTPIQENAAGISVIPYGAMPRVLCAFWGSMPVRSFRCYVALSPQEVDLRRWDDRHTRFLSDGKKRPHAAGSFARDPSSAARYSDCGEVRAESEPIRMKKHRVALLSVRILFGIGTSWALNAQAGFVNQANLPPASIRSPTADGQQKDLQSESARPAHVALREGKGHNVTLSDMLSAVVPHDFHAELRGVHPKQILSWQGGKPWDVVLHSALAATPSAHRIETDIDWARKRLVLRESTQAAESAGDTPRAMHWTVRAQDLTLRRTLMRWAAQAGWQVSWDIRVDYPVQLE